MKIMSCDRREIYCWMRPSRSLSWKGALFFFEVNDESIPVFLNGWAIGERQEKQQGEMQ